MKAQNKKKIINDPVYGFINIPNQIVFDIIEHPYFQRLRHIKQLGLTSLVYPGATHTRFQHALGAMHLMGLAIEILRQKGHKISEEEAEAANIAILLHDIGHGPFSHALEFSIVQGYSHEQMSALIIKKLNQEFNGKLNLALELFNQTYYKRFLCQLVASQLDIDRLDYLSRDSFFTGVAEGVVSYDRIIKMLEVVDGELVVESKGIYSIEKFLIARRLMYWQVYLHKTALVAEFMLVKAMNRLRALINNGYMPNLVESLMYFLKTNEFTNEDDLINHFINIDDSDIFNTLKQMRNSEDFILSYLSSGVINRRLFKIISSNEAFLPTEVEHIKNLTAKQLNISLSEAEYLVFTEKVSNNTYGFADDKIKILYKNKVVDIAEASDMFNHSVLSKTVTKHVLCYPKEIYI